MLITFLVLKLTKSKEVSETQEENICSVEIVL